MKAAWLKNGKMNGPNFAAVAKANFAGWCDGKDALVLDGETCLHGTEATRALKAAKVKAEKLPPASPDFNPIENTWALLQKRLRKTDPAKLETEAEFKTRVGNAIKWLQENKKLELGGVHAEPLAGVRGQERGPDELLSGPEELRLCCRRAVETRGGAGPAREPTGAPAREQTETRDRPPNHCRTEKCLGPAFCCTHLLLAQVLGGKTPAGCSTRKNLFEKWRSILCACVHLASGGGEGRLPGEALQSFLNSCPTRCATGPP